MATYTVETVDQDGGTPTLNAVAASDSFANTNGDTFLWIENGSGAELTVTIVTQQTVSGLAVADQTVTVANGAKSVIGPFKRAVFNDSSGNVTVNYNQTSSVTAACLRVPTAG